MYGQAFRAPGYSQLYDRNNPAAEGNPNLDAQKIKTIEFAYIQQFDILTAGLTYFYSDYTNLIMTVPSDVPGMPAIYGNTGENVTKGLEFEMKFSPIKNIMFNSTFTHFFDYDDTFQMPENTASFALNFSNDFVNINLNAIYRDKIPVVSKQDAYAVFNTNIIIKINKELNFKILVKNIFDKEYQTFSSGMPDKGIINRGRVYTIGAMYNF
jgi:iron complex outermembrane receptor protein